MFDFLNRLNGDQVVGVVGILAGMVALVVLILMVARWAIHSSREQAALKRDMLARGLPVDDIERLCLSNGQRLARLDADRQTKEAQIAADLKRDMLSRGASPDQVLVMAEATALADAIANMVHDNAIDRNAVANLINIVLRRYAEREAV